MFAASKSGSAVGGGPGPTPTDPSFAYVPLLLNTTSTNGQQNNTFLDSGTANGGVGFTITRNGTPTQGSITPYWPNGQWSNYFNGSTDYLTVPFNTILNFGSSNFTIEAWIYFSTLPSNTWYTIYSYGNSSGTQRFSLYFDTRTSQSSPGLRFSVIDSVGTTLLDFNGGGTSGWNAGAWYHIALTRSTNTWTLYRNGTSIGTTTNSTSIPNPSSGGAYIGIETTLVALWNGYFSNLRVVKGVAVYTGAFTPPTAPLAATQSGNGGTIQAITGTQTSLLTCQSNRFLDTSAQVTPATITPTGTPRVQAFQPFSPTASYTTALYGGSSLLPTSADYLTIATNPTFTLGTQSHTVEFWAYQTANTQYATPWSYASTTGNQNTDSYFISNGTLGSNLLVGAGGSWGVNFSFPLQSLNAWHHYAITRSGSSWALFIDGTRVGTATYAGSIGAQTQPMAIGRGNFSPNDTFQGYISNLRIVKGTAVYDPAQTTITVPTSPLTAITNTVLLVNGTNAGIYDAAAQNNFITAGNAQVSIAQAQFPPSSILFDGTGDYLEPVTTPALTLGTSDFTIEGWVYFNSVASFQIMYDQRPPSTNGAYPCLFMNGAVMTWFVNGVAQIASGSLSAGVWYYFAVTRSSSVTKMFINGSQVGSNYSDTTNYLASRTIIGISSYDFLLGINGYLEDFRITKGVARTITANPTAPFPTR